MRLHLLDDFRSHEGDSEDEQPQSDPVMRYLHSQLTGTTKCISDGVSTVVNICADEPSPVRWKDQPSKGQKELEEEEVTPALSYLTRGHTSVPLAFGLEPMWL